MNREWVRYRFFEWVCESGYEFSLSRIAFFLNERKPRFIRVNVAIFNARSRKAILFKSKASLSREGVTMVWAHSNCYCNCYSRPLYLGRFVVPFQTRWWYSWENRCFQVLKWSRVYKWMIFRWIKSNSLENTTWSEIGKQTAPAKEVIASRSVPRALQASANQEWFPFT